MDSPNTICGQEEGRHRLDRKVLQKRQLLADTVCTDRAGTRARGKCNFPEPTATIGPFRKRGTYLELINKVFEHMLEQRTSRLKHPLQVRAKQKQACG